jgi:hypothetical protein
MSGSNDEQRVSNRLKIDLPIRARIGTGDLDLEIVDIPASGMQSRSEYFEVLKGGFDAQNNEGTFEIRIQARLARPEDDSSFVTGWEFNRDEGEPRIG